MDAERIFAALDVYLLAGLMFAICYWLIDQGWPASFGPDLEGGLTLARAGHYDDSYAGLAKLMGPAKPHFYVARMLHHVNQTDACKQHLRQALEQKPDYGEAREFLTYLEEGEKGEAPAAVVAAQDAPAEPVKPILTVSFEEEVAEEEKH